MSRRISRADVEDLARSFDARAVALRRDALRLAASSADAVLANGAADAWAEAARDARALLSAEPGEG